MRFDSLRFRFDWYGGRAERQKVVVVSPRYKFFRIFQDKSVSPLFYRLASPLQIFQDFSGQKCFPETATNFSGFFTN